MKALTSHCDVTCRVLNSIHALSRYITLGASLALGSASTHLQAAPWKPATAPLMTRWAQEVGPEAVHGEYPRPQFQRERWQSLNGLWQLELTPQSAERPTDFSQQVLVPFPIESALSGVMRPVKSDEAVWYRRVFARPALHTGERLLLHFGAVDWEAQVWVNGQAVGQHRGGYDRWSCDVTDALREGSDQELVVRVVDPTDSGYQPRGKQVREPEGIWYTSVTGIWQTVWLEPVPAQRIERALITSDVDQRQLTVAPQITASSPGSVRVSVRSGGVPIASSEIAWLQQPVGATPTLTITIPDAKLWSPSHPFLYDVEIELIVDGKTIDRVTSYAGLRKIHAQVDKHGHRWLMLNNERLFQFGPLDQGWWPDGLYTAPTDAALRFDIEMTKKMGFNMCRKHVKVEPDRWYYWCDKLGLLVWQDMPNGDRHISPEETDITRSEESAANYRREWQAIIDSTRNHPCIVAWVPFNEGWGQFDTDAVLAWTKQYDPSRLVDGPSGWTDRGTGDMHDMHNYPGPAMPPATPERVAVLGEFGGLGLPIENHLWWNKRNWGYRTYKTSEELHTHYESLIERLHPLIARGLAAAIYTQTTDVEGEVNGLMTYDREVIKFDVNRLHDIHQRLYLPKSPEHLVTLTPTSETQRQTWRWTDTEPADNWMMLDFDDSRWTEGPGGFGQAETPGAVIGTPWITNNIWLRRSFTLSEVPSSQLYLRIHHDEDAEVFLNGGKIATLPGYESAYVDLPLSAEALAHLKQGTNVLSIHCRQTQGGQFIDAGLWELRQGLSNK